MDIAHAVTFLFRQFFFAIIMLSVLVKSIDEHMVAVGIRLGLAIML